MDVMSPSDHDQDVLVMLQSLVGMYRCLDHREYQLPPATQAEFVAHAEPFLLHYRVLNLEAIRDEVRRWHEVPKFHYLQHVALMSAYMNPRWAWNYADEDFMRIMKARCSLGSRVVRTTYRT